MADAVLWDRDFLDNDFHLDADPKDGRKLKTVLGINERHFTSLPPAPEGKEMPPLLAALRKLYRGYRLFPFDQAR